jgi:uncharacterized coiled-coil protein SlyX
MTQQTSKVLQETMQHLSENIKATSDKISELKEELGAISDKMLESSNKMYEASKNYFWGSIFLTLIIAAATCVNAYSSWQNQHQSRGNPCQKNKIQNTALGTPE